jgi:enoyl-[acyl-carrier protein] reductase III
MRESPDGQWALILGASSGMGRATAEAWAAAGGNVAGVHFDTASGQAGVDQLVDELRSHGTEIRYYNVNAASKATRAEIVPELAQACGDAGLRMMLHSLAFGTLAPFLPPNGSSAITEKQMDMTLNVMANSLVYWTQDLRAAGLLKAGSKIFAMTSAGDQRVSRNYGAVSAAKCALESHVRQLAFELAPDGVAVNALRAGVTPTPALIRIPEHEDLLALAQRANPHDRLTRPEDVAEWIAVLASSDSSWVTGNVIGVDGGEGLTS